MDRQPFGDRGLSVYDWIVYDWAERPSNMPVGHVT